jgi:CO/xanthine dehydrogenase FAD-binding subunit
MPSSRRIAWSTSPVCLFAGITRVGDTLRVGALTTMEELAADSVVTERLPLVREALLLSASTQLRNMATIGGKPPAAHALPVLP